MTDALEKMVNDFLAKYFRLPVELPYDLMRLNNAANRALLQGETYRADLIRILRPAYRLIFKFVIAIDNDETWLEGIEEVMGELMEEYLDEHNQTESGLEAQPDERQQGPGSGTNSLSDTGNDHH